MTRAILIVLDSVGCGGAEDAGAYGDEGSDTLGHIVEACALGRLLCSGNVWSRIGAKPEKWMTSRPSSPAPS